LTNIPKQAQLFSWDRVQREELNDVIGRRLITGTNMMIAHVYLKKGAIVPKHSHHNEQITYILDGAVKFWLGDDQKEEIIVKSGEVLLIPPHLPHKAEALEDTLDVDVFNPPREDWLDGSDAYLRKGDAS
jgi:quercetin dioxygenase-like cupin family protein